MCHKYTPDGLEAIHPSEIFSGCLEIHTINNNKASDTVKRFTSVYVILFHSMFCSDMDI